MPIPTPFHSRTSKLCTSMSWTDWAGYYSVSSYDTSHEPEYVAFRHSAGLIDVSPLFKYEVKGPDSAAYLSRLTVKNLFKMKIGRVAYLCWCDDEGKIIDDGTVSRLGKEHYRVTAAEPSLSWFHRISRGFDVMIEDSSDRIGALALQGPNSREILKQLTDADMDGLKFFRTVRAKLDNVEVWISRTGYTGDLGYEIWVDRDQAEPVYDALMAAGQGYGILPAGLNALDVTRVEAGFIMNGVDYFSAHHCLTKERKCSPYELGLGWTVQIDGPSFVGQAALRQELQDGPKKALVGLDISWTEIEELFARYGLPPEICSHAWRDGRPVYDRSGDWIGQATSGSWSPTLKKNLALAQIDASSSAIGSKLQIEVTAEYRRHTVTATVVDTPFFNPSRKKSS